MPETCSLVVIAKLLFNGRMTLYRLLIQYRYLIIWFSTAIVLGALLALAETSLQPKNDPNQAYERPGFVIDPEQKVTSLAQSSFPRDGQRLIVFFVRDLEGEALFHDLSQQARVASMSDVAVVSDDGTTPAVMNGIDVVVTDGTKQIADQLLLREPLDEEFPVGYVIIDSEGFVRYRTLDGGLRDRADEVLIVLGDTP